jgi:hypothetical protein
MNVEINTLAWPNTHVDMLKSHSDVCRHLGLEVGYALQQTPHGQWMDNIMNNSVSDVVGFMDIDCVPTNRQVVDDAIAWAADNKSFVGIAQASNHIPPKSHIFASPAFFFIWRKTWKAMQRPTFSETPNGDVAENVCYAAELSDIRYKVLYPTHWTSEPVEGHAWRLHNYGLYGVGTHFEEGVYHLFQGRIERNVQMFVNRCDDIVKGKFTTEHMINSRLPYHGKICP